MVIVLFIWDIQEAFGNAASVAKKHGQNIWMKLNKPPSGGFLLRGQNDTSRKYAAKTYK